MDLKRQAAIIIFALVSATAPQQADAACAGPFKFPATWHLRQNNGVILTCVIIPNGIEGGGPLSLAIKYKFLGSCTNSEGDQGTTRAEIKGVAGEFIETFSMPVDWRNDRRIYTGWVASNGDLFVHDTKIDPPTFPIDFPATWTSDPLICPNEPFEPPSCSTSCHNNETRQWHQDLGELSRKNGAALDQRPSGAQPGVR